MMKPKDASNPWTIHTSEQVYDNPWIKVTENKVTNPSGNPGMYSVVSFKNIAIGIIPLDEDLNTWLVGQYRFPLEQYSWEIPEGGGAKSIPTLESAQRELQEETGITAKEWEIVQYIHTSNSCTDEWGVIYLARDLSFGEAEPEDDEQLEVRKLPFSEVFEMVLDGRITDSLSLAGIYKVQWLIQEGLL